FLFFLYCVVDHRDLHSFPTRRSSDLPAELGPVELKIQVHQDQATIQVQAQNASVREALEMHVHRLREALANNGLGLAQFDVSAQDRKSTRLNSSHVKISYAVFCLKKK